MKLTIEPTEQFFMSGDVMVRAWQGHDDAGRAVVALVAAVGFDVSAEDGEGAGPGLVSIPPPDEEGALRWAHAVHLRRN